MAKPYGQAFLELCEAKEMRISDVLKVSGIPKSTMSKFIHDETSLKIEQLVAAIEALGLDLAEYYHYLSNYKNHEMETFFRKLDRAILSKDEKFLKELYETNGGIKALLLKSKIEGLSEEEKNSLGDYFMGIEKFHFYELYLLRAAVEELSPVLIAALIEDFSSSHRKLCQLYSYRRLFSQIACLGACVCVQEKAQKEAYGILEFAKSLKSDEDSYALKVYRFAQGYYDIFYGQGKERKSGAAMMKKVIEIFAWEGSDKLAERYQKFYDDYVENADLAPWLKEMLK